MVRCVRIMSKLYLPVSLADLLVPLRFNKSKFFYSRIFKVIFSVRLKEDWVKEAWAKGEPNNNGRGEDCIHVRNIFNM